MKRRSFKLAFSNPENYHSFVLRVNLSQIVEVVLLHGVGKVKPKGYLALSQIVPILLLHGEGKMKMKGSKLLNK